MKKIHKIHKKLFALTLAAAMVFGTLPLQDIHAEGTKKTQTAQAEDEIKYERIEISTAEQFADFAAQCYIDSWSENKYVSLKADIDLAGTDIRVIPVFNGIFDGVGHTISGFDYVGDGYVVGLFRYVESQGLIQNLTLKGNIESENQKECIGSICGVNYGSIRNCTFQGTVSGRDTVGGIAGINGKTGIITGCAAKGRITGYYSTGGIVGINHGTLNYCSNRAGINDNSAWVEQDDEMGTGMGILESLAGEDENELYSGVDTGGIAGFSDGVIERCTNSGTVGYEHTGYNIGGIAGRQSGVVSLCSNNGAVYGRKDIGGIVGQMEPYIEINEAESLRDAVNKLHDLIDKTINDMQATKDGVKSDFDMLTTYGDGAVDAADTLADQIGEFVDDNLDQAQAITDRLDHVMEMTPEVFDDFEAAEDSFSDAVSALKEVSGHLDKITDIDNEPYDMSKDRRITLYHTVGGDIMSSSYNPKAGDTVTITVVPNVPTDAYRLKEPIKVFKVTNDEAVGVTIEKSGSRYTFKMPEENVRVEAYFEPDNGIQVIDPRDLITREAAAEDEEEKAADAEKNSVLEVEEKPENDEAAKVEDEEEEAAVVEDEEEKAADAEDGENEGDEVADAEEKAADAEDKEDDEVLSGAAGSGPAPSDPSESSDPDPSDPSDPSDPAPSESASSASSEPDSSESSDSAPSVPASEQNPAPSVSTLEPTPNVPADLAPVVREVPAADPSDPDPSKPTIQLPTGPIPVIKISSNLSGNASCVIDIARGKDEGTATVIIEPSGGYAVDYVKLNGSEISSDGANTCSFPVKKTGDIEYKVSIEFKKITTKSGLVDNAKLEIENAVREAQSAAGRINDTIDAVANNRTSTISAADLQRMLSAATTIMTNTAVLADIYGGQVADALDAVDNDLRKTSDHLKNALDSIKSATDHTRDIVDYVNDQPDITFTKLGELYDYNRINLNNYLHAISDSIKNLTSDASNYSDIVNADLRAVNDQINVIFNLLADRLTDAQKLDLEEVYEEVDDEDIDSITTGRAESCSNKGIIKGDVNVGGIVGSMAIDDEDLEDSAAGSIEYQIGRRYITKCLVTKSVNDGYVTSKKNGAGGICGYMNHGIIIDSESYGSVESTEGDYVGGICGESFTIIKSCYALCSVAGNRNVGGIAGYADTLKNCYSMAEVHSENGRAGAIAGQVSGQIVGYDIAGAASEDNSEETVETKVAGNYYVAEGIHGIDNISYMGMAEPISYQELLEVEQLPEQFWHLKVIYKIEDTYLGSEEVKYGEKLDKLNFPQIPSKDGFYGVWPDVSGKTMTGTMVVEAEYKDNVIVVQSKGDETSAEEGQWQKPYALVEDIFTESTVLNARISDMTPPEEAAEKRYVVYEVALENSGLKETDTFALRLLNPYEDAVVYGYKDGVWTELEHKVRGQYLQVDMTGTQQHFCIVENKSNLVPMIICGAAAAAVVILLIVLIKKGRARRKKRRQKKAEEKAEEKIEESQ